MGNISIKYTYSRFGGGPGVGGNAACSNHHVLPYYAMEYIGLLWCVLAKGQDKYAERLATLVTQAVIGNMIAAMPAKDGVYYIAERASPSNPNPGPNPDFAAFTGAFAWLGENLFTGPAATYRLVDPSQRTEPEKPTSFPDKRWKALNALWQLVSGVGVLPHETGVRRQIDVEESKATKIIDAAMACFFRANAPSHQTIVSDWCAVLEGDIAKGAKTRYRVNVQVLNTSTEVDRVRQSDGTFAWCKLDLVASGGQIATDTYRKIIQVTAGATGHVASIKKTGSPTEDRGNADFVTEFHP
jgi:hypothetical protein